MMPLLHSLQRSITMRIGLGTGAGSEGGVGAPRSTSASQALGDSAGRGWQAKLLQRAHSHGYAYRPRLLFIDPSQFLRNERVFILWLQCGIFVGSLATGALERGGSLFYHTDV